MVNYDVYIVNCDFNRLDLFLRLHTIGVFRKIQFFGKKLIFRKLFCEFIWLDDQKSFKKLFFRKNFIFLAKSIFFENPLIKYFEIGAQKMTSDFHFQQKEKHSFILYQGC